MAAKSDLIDTWPETIAGIFIIVGFFLAIMSQNIAISIVAALCIGTLCARITVIKLDEQPIGPFYIICVGLVLGFIGGSFFVSRVLMSILIITSFILSYYLHKKKIIQTFKSKAFIK